MVTSTIPCRALPRIRTARRPHPRLLANVDTIGQTTASTRPHAAGQLPTSPHHTSPRSPTSPRHASNAPDVPSRNALTARSATGISALTNSRNKSLHGKKPRLNSGAHANADDLEARKTCRLRELEVESDLVNHAPTVVAAALVIPQGLVDRMSGGLPSEMDQEVARETDRRAVAAVIAAEQALGRAPIEQAHNNPGFDILSEDPRTGVVYQIEVKGHRPDTSEIKVRGPQVRQAKQNPGRFRLAVVRVPHEPNGRSIVSYFIRPFDTYELHFAQAYVPLNIADLMPYAVEPQ